MLILDFEYQDTFWKVLPPLHRDEFKGSGKRAVTEFSWLSSQQESRGHWAFQRGSSDLVAQPGCARPADGSQATPALVMFLSGDLSKGVVSAGLESGWPCGECRPQNLRWLETSRSRTCSQIVLVSSKGWFAWFANSVPLSGEFILGIKELNYLVKPFILSKVKSYWKENKAMCEMQNQKESS